MAPLRKVDNADHRDLATRAGGGRALPAAASAPPHYVERTRCEWAAGTRAAFAVVAVDDGEPGIPLGVINLAVAGTTGNSAYWIAPGCRRLGLAGRALRLVTRWGFDDLGLAVVLLEIREENTASIAVATSAGFHRAGRLDVNTTTGKTGGLIYSRLAAYPWIDP